MRRFTCALAIVCLAAIAPVLTQEKAAQDKAAPSRRAAGAASKTSAILEGPVNLNTATATQISLLPGIGPKAAERIVEYRQKNGAFKKIEELMNVKGIGEKSFLKLKPLITVSEKNPAGGQ